ncbi:MAG: hypothetical protein C0609_05345 [Deltaproteobacteria bacterium]|nr:MAG: hypothetical protein C0609_05345 [Deltaproteobacteria bacterium]
MNNRLTLILPVVIVAVSLIGLFTTTTPTATQQDEAGLVLMHLYKVDNLDAVKGEEALTRILKSDGGVTSLSFDAERGIIAVETKAEGFDVDAAARAMTKGGFPATFVKSYKYQASAGGTCGSGGCGGCG